jgi:hypothetical protein
VPGTARYAGAELNPLAITDLGDDADNVRLDPQTGQVVVGYGNGALALIDAATGAKTGDIPLAAHPESFRLEAGGNRIFVNVPEARQIAVIDRGAGQKVASWKLADQGHVVKKRLFEAQGNFPMDLDEAHGRVLVVDRNPPELLVFATDSGTIVARLPTCGDADDIFIDARRERAYVSCGEGFIDVVQRRGAAYEDLARIPTAAGARTALFVPELDRLYLAVRARGNEGAAIWVYRPGS